MPGSFSPARAPRRIGNSPRGIAPSRKNQLAPGMSLAMLQP